MQRERNQCPVPFKPCYCQCRHYFNCIDVDARPREGAFLFTTHHVLSGESAAYLLSFTCYLAKVFLTYLLPSTCYPVKVHRVFSSSLATLQRCCVSAVLPLPPGYGATCLLFFPLPLDYGATCLRLCSCYLANVFLACLLPFTCYQTKVQRVFSHSLAPLQRCNLLATPPCHLVNGTHFDTPFLPKVLVLEISGRMQARSRLCSGARIQSSQYDLGHLGDSSSHTPLVSIQPSPGKKSVR